MERRYKDRYIREIINKPRIISFTAIKGCEDSKCNQTNKEQHDRVIKSVLCNLVLFRKIILATKKKKDVVYYKFNQLPEKIGWYLRCGYINLLKERIEREEKELLQFNKQQQQQQQQQKQQITITDDNSSSSSTTFSSLNLFTIKKDYLFEHHLKWNFKTTEDICSFNGQDEQHLELFKYLFEKKPEWFLNPDCLKMAASKGNLEIFKILFTAAIKGIHPDMALHLLEMNHYQFNVTKPIFLGDGLSKLNQSDLIKFARLFVDIVNENDGISMNNIFIFNSYFDTLLWPTVDMDTIIYADGHFKCDLSAFEFVIGPLLSTGGAPKDMDLDQHIYFIKQVLLRYIEPDEYHQLVDTANIFEKRSRSIDKELDDYYHYSDNMEISSMYGRDPSDYDDYDDDDNQEQEDQLNDDDDENVYEFDRFVQLSTKQSRWYMFLFSMFVPNEDRDWKPYHIFKVRVKGEEKAEFIKMVCEKFGWQFIMNYGTLEYVRLAHLLGLVDPNQPFYPKHKDINQTLAIMKYLHDNGINPFTSNFVKSCGKGDDKAIVFLHLNYPYLINQQDTIKYITEYGHYHLTSVLVVPEVIQNEDPMASQLPCEIKDSSSGGGGINSTSLGVLIKLIGFSLYYYYDDRVGQESFQLLQQYYNDSDIKRVSVESTYQQQLEISTRNNQIEIVDWLLFKQTKFKPTSSTLTNILSESYNRQSCNHQFKALYQLIKQYYRDHNDPGKLLEFNWSTWRAIASRGDTKTFDRFMTKHKPLEDFKSLIDEAITSNQLAFIQHLYTQYGFKPNANFLTTLIRDRPMIMKYFLDLAHQNNDQDGTPKIWIERCFLFNNLSCFKMLLDLDYLGSSTLQSILVDRYKPVTSGSRSSIGYLNLSLITYLAHHGYIAIDDNLSNYIPFANELLLGKEE
ncbi:hypothetical protein DFA_02368 [Cavenderia fasciculata]|uniref:Ankyrin repeat-containing protein n=1 Tax=Cavenderia fasciculata TaxID=261658 RepID=F4PZ92_CACFS|nr:uncharacterized protein DFA_02368 [Cavenderia fasciculata]EGG19121.1 hypothetical protein DFA_02368 [Cavenderia fasciculata]|eukprot:XP_004366754.1 hypothetical protein DFA_02368 [Cavenderia fasciculata]